MNLREWNYMKTNFTGVSHTTLNPRGPGVVRIHLVPPKHPLREPSAVILNGQDILPVNPSWTVLLNEFITQVNRYPDRPLVQELYSKMRSQGLRPSTIVDYTREPYIYRPGNVRVTFDYDIRTALRRTDFLNPDCPTIPAGDPVILLEVKWDNFLPDIIRDAVQTPGRRVTAFSKYARARIYD